MPPLNVALVPAPEQVVVRLTGETDLSTTPLLADALAQAASLGTVSVVVDLAAAHFWDCSGLHVLADFTAELAGAGRQCRLVGATPATRRLIGLADFAPSLALDGPLHLPEVAAPEPTPVRPPEDAPPAPAAAAPRAGGRPSRRRPPVPAHPAPWRRRDGETTDRRRGPTLTLRRWR